MTAVRRLDVRLDGVEIPAGHLMADAHGATSFAYTPDYIDAGGGPLSLSLPLTDVPFGDVATRAFFDNLLPENDQMARVIEREGLARDDIVGILAHVGADCSGAISCVPEDGPPAKIPGELAADYEPLGDDALARIVRSLAEQRRLPDDVGDPSPVAGVQRKLALTRLPDGRLALPKPGAHVPTTHILKVPASHEGRDARLEAAAARLAQAAGLDVAVPEAIEIDGVPALLVPRFDRILLEGFVYRLHQEDFAQALGLPASLKYERNGTPERRFDATVAARLLSRTAAPAAARLAFIKASLFNLAIGNTDNHAKNHALLYDRGAVPRLAPLYDLLPIRLHARYRHDLAFAIGAATLPDAIAPDDLDAFLALFGLEGARRRRFVEGEIAPMLAALEAAATGLRGDGLKDFDDLIGLEMARLTGALGLELALRERDYFTPRGGGWAS